MKLPTLYTPLLPAEKKAVREEYVKLQGGFCWHCKTPLSGEPLAQAKQMKVNPQRFPPNFFKYPVHLHHDHNTDMTLGAVHNHCNAVLWQYFGE